MCHEHRLYEHRQAAPLSLGFVPIIAVLVFLMQQSPEDPALLIGCSVGIFLTVFAGASFTYLLTRDRGDHLLVQFGPVPLVMKRIRYQDLQSVRVGRSRLIDGWGVHYTPRRGWIFNLWGLDCVELQLRGRPFRIGTDDVEALAAHLRSKLEPPCS